MNNRIEAIQIELIKKLNEKVIYLDEIKLLKTKYYTLEILREIAKGESG